MNFAPNGVAFTRRYAPVQERETVWYIDRHYTPNDFRPWLIAPVWEMINSAAASGLPPEALAELPIFKLTPFIETMAARRAARTRSPGGSASGAGWGDLNFSPSKAVLALAPVAERDALRSVVQDIPRLQERPVVDVNWTPERIEEAIDGLDNEPFPP